MNSIPHRTGAIALLSVAQFLVALDFSVVNVALPTMQTQFGASASSLQWVVSAYALMFGGFLLLGGRAADLYGRRRVFMVGMTVFGIASATGAAAAGIATLVAARAAQGIGAATLLPAAVSLIVNLSGEGAARTRAIARLGIIGSAGAAAGVLLGGILTEAI